MTEKRFTFIQDTLVKADVFDGDEFVCCTLSVWVEQLVDLLNQLSEENEQLNQDIRELQNDKLLTGLQMKCDKKQEHIIVLENKIRRMREAIHKLEWLASHRNADLKRENEQLKSQREDLKRGLAEKDKEIMKLRRENNQMKRVLND